MPLILTHELRPGAAIPFQQQVYNGLDCCLTSEIIDELRSLSNSDSPAYTYERAMQGPALEMMLRGFLVDQAARAEGMARLRKEIAQLQSLLDRYASVIWGKGLNPRSHLQLTKFFYEVMRLPEIWTSKKGERKLSLDRDALEKLELYFHARPFVSCILAIRERAKLLEVLETEIDPDGRMRTSYNIAGTETWRWSSSANAFHTGTNLQNITAELRHIFIADPGWKLCGIDLEQAESREVGWLCGVLFGDWSYLDACLSGDLHTTVCRLAWRDLRWPDDNKAARAIAEELFYRHYSRRDMAKKLGHGSNYYGQPPTMARHAKIPVRLAEDFQKAYFNSFPGIPRWHRHVAAELQTSRTITNVWGFTRHFFGRPNDDTTLREAIAFGPQSATGIRLNLALYRVWREMGTRVRIIGQVHDALYFLYRETDDEAAIVSSALKLMDLPITDPKSGRSYVVPGEAKVGWNWGNFDEKKNPDGLKKFKGADTRTRNPSTALSRALSMVL